MKSGVRIMVDEIDDDLHRLISHDDARVQGHEIYERGPNYYSMMGVSRNSTPLDIKRAYKKMSLELHPDKNKSPTAADDFARLKSAYDVSTSFLMIIILHPLTFDHTSFLLTIRY